jgi:hypothetical protein
MQKLQVGAEAALQGANSQDVAVAGARSAGQDNRRN